MSMTDQCPHGSLIGACVYCAIGSQHLDDVEQKLHETVMIGTLKKQIDKINEIEMALEQRDYFLAAMHEITNYIQKNDIQIGRQDCDDCNEILTILGQTMNACIKLEKERKSKN